jgi:crotonobetainyl-CoA:carnitine CoA-transferase CaiB-like acyl-CoA transferase
MAGRLMTLISGKEAGVEAGPITSGVGGGADDRRRMLDAWCADRTTADVCAALLEIGVPVAPVKTIPEVVQDPHTWEREMLVKVDDAVAGEMYVPGVTVKMSATPGQLGPVPTPGQHTDEVLARLLGYDAVTLAELRQAKVIG